MIKRRLVTACAIVFISKNALSTLEGHAERTEVHWSEKKTIESPNKKWQISVSPQGQDGPALVSIRQMNLKHDSFLFYLKRDASLTWSPNSMSFVVVDKQFSDSYRLMVFSNPFSGESEQKSLDANLIVRASVDKGLSVSEHVIYYLPDVIGWTENGWLVAVGFKTLHGEFGPFDSYCVGYVLSADGQVIRQHLTDQELKKNYGATCQM